MNTIAEVKISYKRSREIFSDININTSSHAREIFEQIWSDDLEYKEEMYVLMLDRSNKVLGFNKISTGGTAGTIVDVKILFQLLLKTNTASFILCHNHPSLSLKPSAQDLKLTRRVKEVANFHDINFLDHLILTSESFYSMADEGDL